MNEMNNIFVSNFIPSNRCDYSYLHNKPNHKNDAFPLIHKENKLNLNLFGYPSDILDVYSQELNDTGIQLNKEN